MEENDKQSLTEYEEIGNRTIKLEKWASKAFDVSILLYFLLLYMLLIFIVRPSSAGEVGFMETMVYALGLPGTLLLVLWFLLIITREIHERSKKYDADKIIKLFFYELSEKPHLERRNEILKHLSYNVWRIRFPLVIKGFSILKPPSIRSYLDFRKKDRNLKVEIIDRTMSLVHKSVMYWENQDVAQFYVKIGNCFEEKKYFNLLKILNDYQGTFTKYDEIETGMKDRAVGSKLKIFGEWFVNHAKEIMYFLFIVAFLMYLLGFISSSPPLPI